MPEMLLENNGHRHHHWRHLVSRNMRVQCSLTGTHTDSSRIFNVYLIGFFLECTLISFTACFIEFANISLEHRSRKSERSRKRRNLRQHVQTKNHFLQPSAAQKCNFLLLSFFSWRTLTVCTTLTCTQGTSYYATEKWSEAHRCRLFPYCSHL